MIENGPSLASSRAVKLSKVMVALTVLLVVVSVVMLATFTAYSALQSLLFVLYAYFVLRPFWERDTAALIFVENILCFSLLALLYGLMAGVRFVATLIMVLSTDDGTPKDKKVDKTEKKPDQDATSDADSNDLFDLTKLPHWEIVTGMVSFGLIVLTYLSLAVLGYLLFRELRKTVLDVGRGESLPFSVTGRSPGFGSFGPPPVGSYVSTQTMSRNNNERVFPGRGYKLNS